MTSRGSRPVPVNPMTRVGIHFLPRYRLCVRPDCHVGELSLQDARKTASPAALARTFARLRQGPNKGSTLWPGKHCRPRLCRQHTPARMPARRSISVTQSRDESARTGDDVMAFARRSRSPRTIFARRGIGFFPPGPDGTGFGQHLFTPLELVSSNAVVFRCLRPGRRPFHGDAMP